MQTRRAFAHRGFRHLIGMLAAQAIFRQTGVHNMFLDAPRVNDSKKLQSVSANTDNLAVFGPPQVAILMFLGRPFQPEFPDRIGILELDF